MQLDSADGLYTAAASLTASSPSSSPSPLPSDRHTSTNPPFSHQNRGVSSNNNNATRRQLSYLFPPLPVLPACCRRVSPRLISLGRTQRQFPAPRTLPPRGKRKGIDDQVSKTRSQARVNPFCSARPSPLCCARDESRLKNSKRFANGSLFGCERSLHPLTFSQGMSCLV